MPTEHNLENQNRELLYHEAYLYSEPEPGYDDPAETFHEASKLYPSTAQRLTQRPLMVNSDPDIAKTLARSARLNRQLPRLELPEPALPSVSFDKLLMSRRSRREFGTAPVPLSDLSGLLFSAYGVTGPIEDSRHMRRTVPSGGALFPLELYLVVRDVDGVAPGLYHYDPFEHELELLREGDLTDECGQGHLDPAIASRVAATLLVTAVFWRSRFKYGPRGYRHCLIEAGHVVQNFLLASEALELAAVPWASVYECKWEELLRVDGVTEALIYTVPFGTRPAGDPS